MIMAGSVIKLNEFATSTSLNPGTFLVGYETPTLGGEIKVTLDSLVNSLKNSTNWSSANMPDIDASKITTGILSVPRIPDLDAAKITTGIFDLARIPHHTHVASDITTLIPLAQLDDLTATYLNKTTTSNQSVASKITFSDDITIKRILSNNFSNTTGVLVESATNSVYLRTNVYLGSSPIRYNSTASRAANIQYNAEGNRYIDTGLPSGGTDGDTWLMV